jgi:two-component system response regulator FlrC
LPAQKAGSARSHEPTILLVEDEVSLRSLLRAVLQSRGFRVVAARDCDEALQTLREAERIDLLLTDVQLGEMSGTELAHRVSKDYPTLGVLLTSGFLPESSHLESGMHEGEHQFLAKPFTADALLAKIDDILSSRKHPARD